MARKSKWQFSPKQLLAMYWWKDPEWSKATGYIADGSVRAGKTYAMAFGFMFWAKENFNHVSFGLCGKTIKSFERNVLGTIRLLCDCFGWRFEHRRSKGCVTITYPDGKWNDFYLFGGNDEKSQDLIQGITLAGVLLDEVALMPESFVNQALARCSVTGAKIWMNCNPSSPGHFVKKEFIDKRQEKGYIFSHFTMDDNFTLSAERRAYYAKQWTGVFYRRYVLGEWCAAEGAIYEFFADHKKEFLARSLPHLVRVCIGLDYGASKSRCALICTGISSDRKLYALCESHLEGTHEPTEIYQFVERFIGQVPKLVDVHAQTLWADYGALGQVLTKGLKTYLGRKGVPIEVRDCQKGTIYDRIMLTTRLMGEDRFRYTPYVPKLVKAFEDAVWEEGKEDTRLDNFTSDIDSLDAFEYSIYAFAGSLLA